MWSMSRSTKNAKNINEINAVHMVHIKLVKEFRGNTPFLIYFWCLMWTRWTSRDKPLELLMFFDFWMWTGRGPDGPAFGSTTPRPGCIINGLLLQMVRP
jgi:hypothetical protein